MEFEALEVAAHAVVGTTIIIGLKIATGRQADLAEWNSKNVKTPKNS